MDKDGRLVLLTDNLKRFINNSKTLLFALFFLGVLDASSQEYENNSIDGGKHAEWKTFAKAAVVMKNERSGPVELAKSKLDIEGPVFRVAVVDGAIVMRTGKRLFALLD